MAHAIPGVGVLDGPQSDGRLAPRGSSIVIGISQRRRGDSHHGGDHHEDLTHIGTSWSQTGDVWWWSSTSDEHHEIAFDDSLYDHTKNIMMVMRMIMIKMKRNQQTILVTTKS